MQKVEREMLPYIQCFHTLLPFSAFRCALGRLSSHLAGICWQSWDMPSLLSICTVCYSLWDQHTESSSPRQGNDLHYACNLLWAPRWTQTHSEDKRTLMLAHRMAPACTLWETSGGLWAAPRAGWRR